MWTLKEIESKCYELADGHANDIFIKVYEEPRRIGWEIGVWQSKEAYETKPALGKFFLGEVYATACFRNYNCAEWKRLLTETFTRLNPNGNGDES